MLATHAHMRLSRPLSFLFTRRSIRIPPYLLARSAHWGAAAELAEEPLAMLATYVNTAASAVT